MTRANYKNWMPKGMVVAGACGTGAFLALYLFFRLSGVLSGHWRMILLALSLAGTVVGAVSTLWMTMLYRRFSHVDLPEGGEALDVGCGSGALTIACAKRSPCARVLGVDRWGKEYASFNKPLCESNAQAEGVSNVSFARGDATHLEFEDERFDAVVSNYVYHNIPVRDRQEILMETLRVLKKGGTFALHDIFSKAKYGDMEAFMQKLRDLGYEEVRMIDTTKGDPIGPSEAFWMGLSGSAILLGKK